MAVRSCKKFGAWGIILILMGGVQLAQAASPFGEMVEQAVEKGDVSDLVFIRARVEADSFENQKIAAELGRLLITRSHNPELVKNALIATVHLQDEALVRKSVGVTRLRKVLTQFLDTDEGRSWFRKLLFTKTAPPKLNENLRVRLLGMFDVIADEPVLVRNFQFLFDTVSSKADTATVSKASDMLRASLRAEIWDRVFRDFLGSISDELSAMDHGSKKEVGDFLDLVESVKGKEAAEGLLHLLERAAQEKPYEALAEVIATRIFLNEGYRFDRNRVLEKIVQMRELIEPHLEKGNIPPKGYLSLQEDLYRILIEKTGPFSFEKLRMIYKGGAFYAKDLVLDHLVNTSLVDHGQIEDFVLQKLESSAEAGTEAIRLVQSLGRISLSEEGWVKLRELAQDLRLDREIHGSEVRAAAFDILAKRYAVAGNLVVVMNVVSDSTLLTPEIAKKFMGRLALMVKGAMNSRQAHGLTEFIDLWGHGLLSHTNSKVQEIVLQESRGILRDEADWKVLERAHRAGQGGALHDVPLKDGRVLKELPYNFWRESQEGTKLEQALGLSQAGRRRRASKTSDLQVPSFPNLVRSFARTLDRVLRNLGFEDQRLSFEADLDVLKSEGPKGVQAAFKNLDARFVVWGGEEHADHRLFLLDSLDSLISSSTRHDMSLEEKRMQEENNREVITKMIIVASNEKEEFVVKTRAIQLLQKRKAEGRITREEFSVVAHAAGNRLREIRTQLIRNNPNVETYSGEKLISHIEEHWLDVQETRFLREVFDWHKVKKPNQEEVNPLVKNHASEPLRFDRWGRRKDGTPTRERDIRWRARPGSKKPRGR